MCGNRVEELESRVKELEASVEGLTDELVECKVRLRELENAVDADIGFGVSAPDSSSETAAADSTKSDPAEPANTTEESDSEAGEIIVA
jgi:hypothetical protein